MLPYNETPVQPILHPALEAAGVKVFVKREDLNHPLVSGNKWWKLRDNLILAKEKGRPVLTFGGAYSNHIYATAAAASLIGLRSIGVIRGERIEPLNTTLNFAEAKGMQLHFVSRELYKTKGEAQMIENLRLKFGDFYLIPEGGTNSLAIKACADFAKRQLAPLEFDELFLAVGTGGTISGIIAGLDGNRKITGVSVLKNGMFLNDEVKSLLESWGTYENWKILTSYHHGGYAKITNELSKFIDEMDRYYNLPLDPVYTAKSMWALMREVEEGRINSGSRILMLHTGGLQNSTHQKSKSQLEQ